MSKRGPYRYERDIPDAKTGERDNIITDHDGIVVAIVLTSHEAGRLLAAAPDLLAACNELIAAMVAYELDVEDDAPQSHRDMMARARAAIAKARGTEA